MELLHCNILSIEGRQYINYYQEPDEYEPEQQPEDVCEEPPHTRSMKSSFRETVPCPNALFRHVIGYRGQTIKRLQEETGTHIEVPKGRSASGLVVNAESADNLEAALTRIQLLLAEKRWKEPFRHFISIPLTPKCIKSGFEDFKTRVLETCGNDRGVEERLFQDKNKLHLTIGTLVLLDDSECEKAIKVMQRIQDNDLMKEARATHIRVCGIEYMNDDPEMVDVLYAKVECPEKSGFLQKLSDYIVSEFVDAGLMKQEYDHVKLHATVMNTIRTMGNKKTPQEKGAKKNAKRETFDARNVLSHFVDYKFGTFPLEEIHISQRYSTDKNGYYDNIYIATIQQ